MRKKNFIVGGIVSIIIVALAVLLLQQTEKLPLSGEVFAQKQIENRASFSSAEQQADVMPDGERGFDQGVCPVVGQDKIVLNDNQNVQVIHASVSKKLHNLNKVNTTDYYTYADTQVDGDNTFLSAHLYIEVGVNIENTESEAKELCLGNNLLVSTDSAGNDSSFAHLAISSISSNTVTKASGKLVLAPKETKTVYLGYIIPESEYQEFKGNIYLLPDYCGVFAMDRELLCKIKLDIQEDL